MVGFPQQHGSITRNNKFVSGIPTDWTKIIPNDQIRRFNQPANFNANKVLDNYIELRFNYRSIYADEIPKANHSGELKRAYKLTPDRKHCILIEQQT